MFLHSDGISSDIDGVLSGDGVRGILEVMLSQEMIYESPSLLGTGHVYEGGRGFYMIYLIIKEGRGQDCTYCRGHIGSETLGTLSSYLGS